MMLIQDVLKTTGVTATAGIGTNLYFAKIAMDIQAKHIEWLRVMKHAGQLVQQVPRNAPSLEDAVARKLGRLLTEEEAEIMGYFAAGIQHERDD